jgi:undecaprenyl diphosphate synthase
MSTHPYTTGGLHVAIIMDGNGRWAEQRGWPREAGHRAGAGAVRRTVEAAPSMGIRVLTLYAFSSDNWKRPAREVSTLMRLFRTYLGRETGRCVENGIRLNVIGRRDRLPRLLLPTIEEAERRTAGGRTLHLRLAVDYSSRDRIVQAAAKLHSSRAPSREVFAHLLNNDGPVPDVDLLIRTGGEQRLSDFLLWESAYAELHFTPCMWPDFAAGDLQAALDDFHRRQRRFGALPAVKAG